MSETYHPFSVLTPDFLLDAIESLGLEPDGRLLVLNSYENRVYQFWLEDGTILIIKFYRPERWSDQAISEEHQFLLALSEDEIPVVAPLLMNGKTLHQFKAFRFAIFPKQGGRSPELDRAGVLERMGCFIGRIHAVGKQENYYYRPSISLDEYGLKSFKYLQDHQFIPEDIQSSYESVAELALDGIARCFERAGTYKPIRLHGDCHLGNILWTDTGPHFVDFDDSMMGPAVQDLWMLLSGNEKEMRAQLQDVLLGYETFCEFDSRELYLVEALRTLRMMHHSAWIARRWSDPAFPIAFPWFNSQQYWQNKILELREQIAAMDESPLWQGNC